MVCTWLKGNGSPSWRTIIELSFVFQVPLTEILQGHLDGISISTIRRLPLAAVTRLTHPRKSPERRDIEKIKSFLSNVEAGLVQNIITMRGAADRINIDTRELRRIVPIESSRLSKLLAKRRQLVLKRNQENRERLFKEEIPTVISKILSGGLKPTRRTLWRFLEEIGISARRREAPLIKEIVQNTLLSLQNNSGNK